MRPVRIWIKGSFWDSQIYSGELTLFGADGAMHRIDWSSVIDELADGNAAIQTALRVAFSDADLFYTQKVQRILRDPAIEKLVREQLCQLALLSISGSQASWSRHWKTGATPFSFLPTDTDIYYHRLFAAGDQGLFSAPRSASLESALSEWRSLKHHDGRVLQVKASTQNTALAAAAGADGLFEFPFESKSEKILDRERHIAAIPCSACDWAFQSIVAWNAESAFFASFREDQDPSSKKKTRTFDQVLRQEQIFTGEGLPTPEHARIWGSHEKLFRISSDGLEVLDYTPPSNKPGPQQEFGRRRAKFSSKGKLSVAFDPDAIIATGTAPFGTVLEFADKLVVLRSDGELETFDGEPVHWRVFPRSEYYSNQLHIIYDDSILIISFLHDYFVEQTGKLMGFARGSNSLAGRNR
jgi:hypothetical protein